ncbi:MAG TPA: hypothetical protein VFV99_32750, partial [Kofleriaceae bacterium]|nr:hypothetical protein [Kofleriaceae bacterium]
NIGNAQPVPLTKPAPPADDEPEIEVLPTLDAVAAEPAASSDGGEEPSGKQGWVSSLLNRLSRTQKR